LVVRMHHHDNRRAFRQRLAITGLLVRPVPLVTLVHDERQVQSAREINRAVLARVIYENTLSTKSWGNSSYVCFSVCSALYAGITTTTHRFLIARLSTGFP